MVSATVLFSALSALALVSASAASPAHGAGGDLARRHTRHRALAGRKQQQQQQAESLQARSGSARAVKQVRRAASSGAQVCRIRGSNATTTVYSSTMTATASSSSAASSTSATSAVVTTSASSATASASSSADNNNNNYVAASSSSSAAPAASSSTSSNGGSSITSSGLTPNGKKAGIAGGDSYDFVKDHIGWWYDWSADPSGHSGSPIAVPMLWGDGAVDSTDASRLAAFKSLSYTPQYVLGYEEPDCSTWGSANVDVDTGARLWNELIAPLGDKGALLGSPSMCHQAAESGWLQPFQGKINRMWDFTAIHVNKNSMAGVKADLDHYWNTYGKPIWVTEFACVDDSTGFVPCTDQGEIDNYINEIVALFESDSRVYAYAFSDGEGLGSAWRTTANGALTAAGQTYLNAISQY